MATADLTFIKNFKPSPITVEFPAILYAHEESVRDSILNTIKASGQPEGRACIKEICFVWRVARLDDELKMLPSEGCKPRDIKQRVVVIDTVDEAVA